MNEAVVTTGDLNRIQAGPHQPWRRDRSADGPEVDADYEALMRDGFVVLEGLISADEAASIKQALTPVFDHTGRNAFEGHKTQRIYNVLAKTRACDRLADHPRILALLDRIFQPNYLLSQMQAINILPGESAQALHHDDAFYPLARPRAALGAASIWALDDFTTENGATRIVPGSHLWGADRLPDESGCIQAAMPAGSAVFFLGTTWHSGGANASDTARMAFTCQYCEPWLRQQENFLLEVPFDIVRQLSEPLQSMIGYSIHPPFMGMVNGRHPKRAWMDGFDPKA